MSYNRRNKSDRDALFGSSSKAKSGPKHKREVKSNRDALFGGVDKGKGEKSSSSRKSNSGSFQPSSSASSATNTSRPSSSASDSRGYNREVKSRVSSGLSGAAKISKLKEANDFRDKATKSMQRGMFTRPDPVMAGNYYKRAADAYGLCGENRLERLHRVASADCQMGTGGYSTAATEYMKAGELVKKATEEVKRKRKEGWKFYSDAANAWEQANELAKAAQCRVLSALAWTWEDDSRSLKKQALISLEEAVEAHVPDVLNIYSRFRKTGVSKYADPSDGAAPPKEIINLAKENMVKKAYAHEPVQEVVYALVKYGEYQSALYACGAASAMLEADGISTMTLSKSYVMETILALSTGDPVLAERQFLDRHVQKTHYITTRECKLSEDLFRAILNRDPESLEEARSPQGENRNGMAGLPASMRDLVQTLRVSGAARRNIPPKETASKNRKTMNGSSDGDDSSEEPIASSKNNEDENLDSKELGDELNDVMADLDGVDIGNDDDNSNDDLDDSDSDIDLR